MNRKALVGILVAVAVVAAVSVTYFSVDRATGASAQNSVRIGYFPNLSHAQALVGIAKGTFEEKIGNDAEVTYKLFSAGPAAVEALFTNQIDIAYLGPSPAINGYVRSDETLKIISGSASGGVVFVVRSDTNIESVSDLVDKRLASPQYGNTQDISLKSYLTDHGYRLVQYGGSVHVLPAKNSDIMLLFLKNEIDGAWVPEPWGSLLVRDANGKILVDERDLWDDGEFATTLLAVNLNFLQTKPDLVKKVLDAHVDITLWINEHPEDAKETINDQLEKITGKRLASDVLDEAFDRLKFTYNPMQKSVSKFGDETYELGLFPSRPDLSGIYYTELLNEVLREKGLPLAK